jgi:hypothetical protein
MGNFASGLKFFGNCTPIRAEAERLAADAELFIHGAVPPATTVQKRGRKA